MSLLKVWRAVKGLKQSLSVWGFGGSEGGFRRAVSKAPGEGLEGSEGPPRVCW